MNTNGDANPASSHLVFVYGTLRPGQPRSHVLETSSSAIHIGSAITKDTYHMYAYKGGGFPYLLLESIGGTSEPTKIQGNLWRVPDEILRDLDMIEGHPDHYTRFMTTIDLVLDASEGRIRTEEHEAWVYVCKQDHIIEKMKDAYPRSFVEVVGGCWVDWVEKEMPLVWRTRTTPHRD